MQEESEPGAFAASRRADSVHAVVPIACTEERKTVRAGGRAFLDRTDAVLEQRADFMRDVWYAVGFMFIGGEEWRDQKGHPLAQNVLIAGRTNVLGDDVRQPEEVIRATATKPAARGFVPPVLDVALDELASRSAEDVIARERRLAEEQRHHILQLIAKAIRAAGLIVPGARPQPAAHVLVQQPAIDQGIERVVRRAHVIASSVQFQNFCTRSTAESAASMCP